MIAETSGHCAVLRGVEPPARDPPPALAVTGATRRPDIAVIGGHDGQVVPLPG
ncbi:hypothetical protein [Dactylosporangium sp. CA-092794]|uniref:hypothetical protein n=1 Tax=Dactylosporangium sp. CA-092794 TaxID=3239929 RepID=UPI003D90A69C